MNLYRIAQTENDGYDTFDSAIVAANTEERARRLHPQDTWSGRPTPEGDRLSSAWDESYHTWASRPDNVTVTCIGIAAEGTPEGVVLASFNAG